MQAPVFTEEPAPQPIGEYDAGKQALAFGLTEAELEDQPADIQVSLSPNSSTDRTGLS